MHCTSLCMHTSRFSFCVSASTHIFSAIAFRCIWASQYLPNSTFFLVSVPAGWVLLRFILLLPALRTFSFGLPGCTCCAATRTLARYHRSSILLPPLHFLPPWFGFAPFAPHVPAFTHCTDTLPLAVHAWAYACLCTRAAAAIHWFLILHLHTLPHLVRFGSHWFTCCTSPACHALPSPAPASHACCCHTPFRFAMVLLPHHCVARHRTLVHRAICCAVSCSFSLAFRILVRHTGLVYCCTTLFTVWFCRCCNIFGSSGLPGWFCRFTTAAVHCTSFVLTTPVLGSAWFLLPHRCGSWCHCTAFTLAVLVPAVLNAAVIPAFAAHVLHRSRLTCVLPAAVFLVRYRHNLPSPRSAVLGCGLASDGSHCQVVYLAA